MKKLITAIFLLAALSASAAYYNTTTQRKYTTLPQSYAGVSHYPMATHRHASDGFYPLVEFILPDGCQKLAGTQTFTLANDVVTESWQVQTDAESEEQRQSEKPQALKETENAFMDMCQQLGSSEKLGFDELQTIITNLQQTDPDSAIALSLQLLTLDAAGKRYSATWWDDCVRHEEVAE